MDGSPAKEMNEIEYWRGKVLVSVEDGFFILSCPKMMQTTTLAYSSKSVCCEKIKTM